MVSSKSGAVLYLNNKYMDYLKEFNINLYQVKVEMNTIKRETSAAESEKKGMAVINKEEWKEDREGV